MSILTGKEALIALANDKDVEYLDENLNEWVCMDMAHHFKRKFRLKPRTITINGIEVPAPFEPKVNDEYFYIHSCIESGYALAQFESIESDFKIMQFGAWRTKEEIKQVVAALRQVLGGVR